MAEPLGHISSISTKSFKFFLFVKSIFLYTVINDNPVNEISVYKDGPSTKNLDMIGYVQIHFLRGSITGEINRIQQ